MNVLGCCNGAVTGFRLPGNTKVNYLTGFYPVPRLPDPRIRYYKGLALQRRHQL
ncbi:hypothetical protein [Niastella caeni]|uniref:hypothetical protein n=1 Tax=Niastella caeni TaxID=2569763 RepID=UPI00129BED04|nr:hypothetical protein [Niastella caeni]